MMMWAVWCCWMQPCRLCQRAWKDSWMGWRKWKKRCHLYLSLQSTYLLISLHPLCIYFSIHSSLLLSLPFLYVSIHPPASISFCLCCQETRVQSLSQEDPLEKETAAHSRTVAWEEEPCQATVHGVAKESDTTEWLIHLSMYLWPAYLIYLPISIHSSCIHLTMSFFLFPSIYLPLYHLS